MSSLDELILSNSAFWREEGMLDGTKYAYMKKLAEHCRRAAGANFPAGYYEPESMPYMLALRDACAPSVPLAGARGRIVCIRYHGAGAGDDAAGIRPYQIAAPQTVYGARLSVRI